MPCCEGEPKGHVMYYHFTYGMSLYHVVKDFLFWESPKGEGPGALMPSKTHEEKQARQQQ